MREGTGVGDRAVSSSAPDLPDGPSGELERPSLHRSTLPLVGRKELGIRLHLLRFVRGHLSLLAVERVTGIAQSSLSRWERAEGKRYPEATKLAILAEFYGVSVGALLDPEHDTRAWLR